MELKIEPDSIKGFIDKKEGEALYEYALKYSEKGNKSAGARARKSLGEIKKLVTEYRKLSVEDAKS